MVDPIARGVRIEYVLKSRVLHLGSNQWGSRKKLGPYHMTKTSVTPTTLRWTWKYRLGL